MAHDHAHGHGPRRPAQRTPARVVRLLTFAIAPLMVLALVGLVALWPRGRSPGRPDRLGQQTKLVNGTVTGVHQQPCGGGPATSSHCQVAHVRITSGPDRGTSTDLEFGIGAGNPSLKAGDPIVVGRTTDPAAGVFYAFADYQRRTPLLLLAVIFSVVVIAIGRLRGLAALGGLVVTFAVLVKFVLPAILRGESPILVAIVGSAVVMFVIMYLAHGLNAQTTTAVLGTFASLAIIAALAAAFVALARIVNLGSEEATYLQVSAAQVNLRGLLLAGVIIGSLGVLNDVTVTQASAVWALRQANPGSEEDRNRKPV